MRVHGVSLVGSKKVVAKLIDGDAKMEKFLLWIMSREGSATDCEVRAWVRRNGGWDIPEALKSVGVLSFAIRVYEGLNAHEIEMHEWWDECGRMPISGTTGRLLLACQRKDASLCHWAVTQAWYPSLRRWWANASGYELKYAEKRARERLWA